MIKIERTDPPVELTDNVAQELTEQYMANTSRSVWDKSYIKRGLFSMGYGKCIYCECSLGEESKYMEVEHFRHKNSYADLVVSWSNLLPACRRCNAVKGTHDVQVDGMIIDPTDVDPVEHLTMKNYRLQGRTELGTSTIKTVGLNDQIKLVAPRFEVGDGILEKLEELHEKVATYRETPSAYGRGRILSTMRAVLSEAQPSSNYCATVCTILKHSSTYQEIVAILNALELWGDEFTALAQAVQRFGYD
ncbi:hypothetical protein ACFW0F_15330 [Brucella anthropi]|uniref:hypothetical protein n=1 Tax=Brucella anthropi TaxID=529 RepID=UPI003673170D